MTNNKKTIKVFLSGPDIFYPNNIESIEEKISILQDIICPYYNFENMSPGNQKYTMPNGCIRYWKYLLGDKSIQLTDEDFKEVKMAIDNITKRDCDMIEKLAEDKNALGICLCNLDPFPSILGYNADPGTVFEYGYANGIMKYNKNLFALAYYTKENLDLLDNKMANLYGGFKNCYLTDYGLKDKNDNYIICWNLRENAMLEYTSTSRILDKHNIKTVSNSFKEVAYNILKVADLYFSKKM